MGPTSRGLRHELHALEPLVGAEILAELPPGSGHRRPDRVRGYLQLVGDLLGGLTVSGSEERSAGATAELCEQALDPLDLSARDEDVALIGSGLVVEPRLVGDRPVAHPRQLAPHGVACAGGHPVLDATGLGPKPALELGEHLGQSRLRDLADPTRVLQVATDEALGELEEGLRGHRVVGEELTRIQSRHLADRSSCERGDLVVWTCTNSSDPHPRARAWAYGCTAENSCLSNMMKLGGEALRRTRAALTSEPYLGPMADGWSRA